MDFQEKRQTDDQETPVNQPGQPYQGRPPYGNGMPYPAPPQSYGSGNGSVQQPYGSESNNGSQQPCGDNGAVQQPCGNGQSASRQSGNVPNQNNAPYGSQYPNRSQPPYSGGYPSGNYGRQNGYNSHYPYYDRSNYQIPVSEPGGSLAKAAMICGIVSLGFGLIFPIYPTFSLAGVAIMLAVLSRGRSTKLPSKARTGVICAVTGLVFNVVIVASAVVPVLVDPVERENFNRTWEAIYGEPFEDTMEKIMGDDYNGIRE